MKIKPLIKIEISALNQEKMLNKLLENHIEIYDIKRQTRTETIFEIESKNINKTEKILSNNAVTIINRKSLGMAGIKAMFLLRLGIFIGILFSLILCVIASFFVLKIDIQGTNLIKNEEILQSLYEKNIDIFSSKADVNTSNLELYLFENFNEISMVSVAIKGATLIVNIKEKSVEEINAQQKYSNLVANFNGRISQFSLVSGTAMVSVGDIVEIGDTLVKAESKDSAGNLQQIEAKAEITAEVWSEFRYTHYDAIIEIVETGRQISSRQVFIFGIEIFNKTPKIEFEKFETETIETKLTNTILPLNIKQIIYKEVKENQIISNFEEQKEQIVAECKQNALQNLKDNDIIKNEDYTIVNGQGFTNVCYVITAERKVF